MLGKVAGGYLIQEWPDPDDYEWRVGVQDDDGDVAWLDGTGLRPEPLLSTDHAYAAVDDGSVSRVYDLRSATQVAEVHAEGVITSLQFLDAGLLYAVDEGSPDEQVLLWNPADPNMAPVVQHYDPQQVSDDLSRALVTDGQPCWEAVEIAGNEQGDTLYRSCGMQRTFSISPDGRYALTVDLKVVDLDGGTVSAFQGAPTHGIVMPIAVWENSEHVLLRVQRTPTRSGMQTNPVIIRCSVVSLTCEVAVDAAGDDVRVLDATRRS